MVNNEFGKICHTLRQSDKEYLQEMLLKKKKAKGDSAFEKILDVEMSKLQGEAKK